MRFLVDSMLPPGIAELLDTAGHDATTAARLGAHNLPDDRLIQLVAVDGRVIITENARDSQRPEAARSCSLGRPGGRRSRWPKG